MRTAREQQAGFTSNRSCSGKIFTLRNITEQCIEFQQSILLNFVDFIKGFDSVHRESLWKIAALYGILQKYIKITKNMYLNSSCCIKTKNGYSEVFNVETGAIQGCILSPFLFLLLIDFILKNARGNSKHGIQWYNQQHLANFDFADDIVLIVKTFRQLENLTYGLYDEKFKVGLKVSDEKTKSMQIMETSNNRLSIQNTRIKDVDAFLYLSSVVTTEGETEEDIKRRLDKAMGFFSKTPNFWSLTSISIKIKLQMYNTIVLPTALYANETWKSIAAISKKLDVFHQRCLW